MEDHVEAGRLVHLVRVERVERPRRPGPESVDAEAPGKMPPGDRRQQARQEHGHVVGEHRVPGRPDDGRDEDRRQQPVVRVAQRVRQRIEDVRVEDVRGRAEELVNVPRDEVDALDRIPDVGDGIGRMK